MSYSPLDYMRDTGSALALLNLGASLLALIVQILDYFKLVRSAELLIFSMFFCKEMYDSLFNIFYYTAEKA